jgi:plastocyanin
MRTTVLTRTAALRICAALYAVAAAAHSSAATLEISVVDEQGRPIENVAVYATPAGAAEHSATSATAGTHAGTHTAAAHAAAAPKAVMDQHGLQFVPHLLVVQSGTEVTFPNGDDVSHHVYSFSETKPFELPLYKGDAYPPVLFDRAGIVVLGCDIHDGMLGYIVVVDTPHFAQTNEQGVALIDGVPNGDYVVAAWTPRVRPASLPPSLQVAVAGQGAATAEIRIKGRLAPAHQHGASSLTWERY